MKIVLVLLLAIAAAACSVLDSIGTYANDNPLLVDAATRQAVYRYVDAGGTEAAKTNRAKHVVDAVVDLDGFLEGNPTASVSTLLAVIDSHVKWDELAVVDRLLVEDIMTLVKLSLEAKQEQGVLSDDAVVGIRALLRTAVQTASLL